MFTKNLKVVEAENLNISKLSCVLIVKVGKVFQVHIQKCIGNYRNEAFNITTLLDVPVKVYDEKDEKVRNSGTALLESIYKQT